MQQRADDFEPTFNIKWYADAKRSRKRKLLSEPICLDTETSHNHDEEKPVGWVYQWAFAVGCDVVTGRTPSELMGALRKVVNYVHADKNNVIICFVHNLAYDLAYLRPFLHREFGKCTGQLAISNHKFITYTVGCIEFRCSYKLSNDSLANWAKKLNCEHRKLEGAIDYESIHTQQEELTTTDWDYQIEDVLTLQECLYKTMSAYKDTIASMPLTSTGYVRRECKRHYAKDRKNRKRFLLTRDTPEVYTMLRRAFAGGLTHGNRFYSEMTVEGEIRHRDYRSHYPSQQRTSTCPVGKFNLWSDGGTTLEELEELKKKYCLLFDVILTNPRIKDGVTLPVISESKARQGSIGLCHFVSDNGRVMRCEGTFCLSVTDLDFYWIEKQYDRDELYIGALYVAKRGIYPKYLRDTIDEFMFGKSDIKERIESETDYIAKLDLETALLKSKNGLNGLYGMSATDPVRTTYTIDEAGNWHEDRPENIGAVLDKYYKNENNFNRFCLGVWCTASARDELLSEIERIESAGGIYLYCDTDSCFYASTPEVEEELEKENLRRRKKSDEIGAYIETSSGKRVHYNQFCDEKENIRRFRFLHAKCYGYELKQKRNAPVARCKGSKRRSVYYSYSRIRVRNFKAVIAGVNAFEDATRKFSREQELWKLDNLRDGFVFERCGGTTSKYEDKAQIDVYYWNGQPQEVATWCIIKKTTKELNNQVKMIEKNVIYERR